MVLSFAIISGIIHAGWLKNRYQGVKDWGSRQKYRFDKKFKNRNRFAMPRHKSSKENFMNYYIKEVGLNRRQAEIRWKEREHNKKVVV